jgi:uncharacterized protein YkwD
MSIKTAAILSSLLLAGFLLLRPLVGRLGTPKEPDVSGRSAMKLSPEDAASLPGPDPKLSSPAPAATGGTASAATAGCGTLDEVEARVFDLTNEERKKAGRSALATEPVLRETARAQSADMLARSFFNHVNPDGEGPEDRIAIRHRQLVGLVSENLWLGSGIAKVPAENLALEIVTGWMKSPGHRENILRPESTHLGVGVCATGNEVRATQNFARVSAYLETPLPASVARGNPLALALSPAGAAGFDLWSPDRGLAQGARMSLVGGRAGAEPGVYKLRFYFPTPSGQFSIVPGPQIEVQ